jgi:hypothetical protein
MKHNGHPRDLHPPVGSAGPADRHPKTLAVTIGIGDAWRSLAERAATRMSQHTGLPSQVLSSCPHLPAGWSPSWAKAWAFDLVPDDIDRLLIFDADIYCTADWHEWDTDQPLAVVRHIATRGVQTETQLYTLREYWNAGLFVITRSLADALRLIATYGPRYGSWLEQTAAVEIFEHCDKAWLPARCNWLLAPPGRALSAPVADESALGAAMGALESGATNLHFTGYGGDPAKIHHLYDQLDDLL